MSDGLFPSGITVHLRGYGFVKVFRTVAHTAADYWATNHLQMTAKRERTKPCRLWRVEVYHRALKQFTGVERAQFRGHGSQRNHIGLALRAFCVWSFIAGALVSRFDAKMAIIRVAVRLYLAHPIYCLPSTA